MAFPVAGAGTTPPIYPVGSLTPTPAYTGTFIPTIWSGKLIEKFYASTVLAAISNTDYEGEIKNKGDKVIIRTKRTITIKDYRADGALEVERPASNVVELLIDRGKYFNLILDDVYEVQADINMMNIWSDDAAQQFKLVVDREVLVGLLGKADPKNRGTTAGFISSNINLGVTGTPVVVVARAPTAGQTEVTDLLVRLGNSGAGLWMLDSDHRTIRDQSNVRFGRLRGILVRHSFRSTGINGLVSPLQKDSPRPYQRCADQNHWLGKEPVQPRSMHMCTRHN
jgi:hypothetical protein